MTEFRWLIKRVEQPLSAAESFARNVMLVNGTAYERVLQYRVRGDAMELFQWSEWRDVPTVVEKAKETA